MISVSVIFVMYSSVYAQNEQSIIDIINDNQDAASDPETNFFSVSPNDQEEPNKSDSPIVNTPETEGIYYSIQLGIFLSEEKAFKKTTQLKDNNLDPYIFQSINKNNQTVFAVRVGKYNDYSEAKKHLSQFEIDSSLMGTITYFNSLELATSEQSTFTCESIKAELAPPKKIPEPSSTDNDFFADNTQPSEEKYSGQKSHNLIILQQKIEALESQVKEIQEENEARNALRKSKAEEDTILQEQKDILEDADRQYTLRNVGEIEFNIGVSYSHNTYDAIRQNSRVEDVANHTISTSLGISYGLKNI